MSSVSDETGPKSSPNAMAIEKEDNPSHAKVVHSEPTVPTPINNTGGQCGDEIISGRLELIVSKKVTELMNKVMNGKPKADRSQDWYMTMNGQMEKLVRRQVIEAEELIKSLKSQIPADYVKFVPPPSVGDNVTINLQPRVNIPKTTSTTTTTTTTLSNTTPSSNEIAAKKRKRNDGSSELLHFTPDQLAEVMGNARTNGVLDTKNESLQKIQQTMKGLKEQEEKIKRDLNLFPYSLEKKQDNKQSLGKRKNEKRPYKGNKNQKTSDDNNNIILQQLIALTNKVEKLEKEKKNE